jgi:hypothetical protein
MRNAARLAALLMLGVFVLAAGGLGARYGLHDRDYAASVPQPPPLYRVAYVPLPPVARACWGPVVVDTHSERAFIRVATAGKPGAALTFSLQGAGWAVTQPVPAGYGDNSVLAIDVPRPPHDIAARACVRNDGTAPIALFASDDRTKAPYETQVGARAINAVPDLSFYERTRHSIASRLPLTLERVRAFRFGFLHPWLLWPLAVLLVVGTPLTLVWGYARAIREDDAPSRRA